MVNIGILSDTKRTYIKILYAISTRGVHNNEFTHEKSYPAVKLLSKTKDGRRETV